MKNAILRFFGMGPILAIGHPDNVMGRSPMWDRVRRQHLKVNPRCCVSGLETQLEVHHVKPFHLFPELELEPTNLTTISRPYHFLIGHLCNWSTYNADFSNMVAEIRIRIMKGNPPGMSQAPWIYGSQL